jgi:hypothetical protein
MNDLQQILDDLRKPFHPSQVTWKPGAVKGERALALAYADLRAYMNRLDQVCGGDWSVSYEPWGQDRIICRLTIMGVIRSSTGESTNESEKSEIGGTVAEAQAFKRACAMFGLGRYLYNLPTGWADYDPKTKQFTAGAKAKLMGMVAQHYRRAMEGDDHLDSAAVLAEQAESAADAEPSALLRASRSQLATLDEIGRAYYQERWAAKTQAEWAMWASDNRVNDFAFLEPEQADAIMQKIRERMERKLGQAANNGAHA